MSDESPSLRVLPAPMLAFNDERVRLKQMLDAVHQSSDPVERADLAAGIVDLVARYENIKSEVLYPFLAQLVVAQSTLDQAASQQEDVRAALSGIRARTRHVKPMYAHAEMGETIDRRISDESTPWHPGLDRLPDAGADGDVMSPTVGL